mmetsp:Transcript_7686/g.9475  ORF Transcript_7686/g.9475 Transcript_7686/m.9475 type:complete len:88 (+) Transcript_7686:119-382(+)
MSFFRGRRVRLWRRFVSLEVVVRFAWKNRCGGGGRRTMVLANNAGGGDSDGGGWCGAWRSVCGFEGVDWLVVEGRYGGLLWNYRYFL